MNDERKYCEDCGGPLVAPDEPRCGLIDEFKENITRVEQPDKERPI